MAFFRKTPKTQTPQERIIAALNEVGKCLGLFDEVGAHIVQDNPDHFKVTTLEADRLFLILSADPSLPKGSLHYNHHAPEDCTISAQGDPPGLLHVLEDLRDTLPRHPWPQKRISTPQEQTEEEILRNLKTLALLSGVAVRNREPYAPPANTQSKKNHHKNRFNPGNPDFVQLYDKSTGARTYAGVYMVGDAQRLATLAEHLKQHGLTIHTSTEKMMVLTVDLRGENLQEVSAKVATALQDKNQMMPAGKISPDKTSNPGTPPALPTHRRAPGS